MQPINWPHTLQPFPNWRCLTITGRVLYPSAGQWSHTENPRVSFSNVCIWQGSVAHPLSSREMTLTRRLAKLTKAERWSLTLRRYYDLISLSSSLAMQTKRLAVYVANSTRPLYLDKYSIGADCLDVRDTCISMDSTPYGWFYSRSTSTSVTTSAIGSVSRRLLVRNEFYPV